MDEITQIQRLGWEWKPEGIGSGTGPGVLLKVQVNGMLRRVFMPLSRVWVSFDHELQAVGCPSSQSVGAPFSVGGFFSFVKHAVQSVAKKVVPKAIRRAANRVVSVAKHYGGAALHAAKAVSQNPVFRGALIAASFAVPALAPAAAALEIAHKAHAVYERGRAAAHAIKNGIHTAENHAAMVQGIAARSGLAGIIALAQRGDPRAKQVMGAFQHFLVNQERTNPGGALALQHAASAMKSLRLF